MKHYIFIRKNLPLNDVKIYGSIAALVENENIVVIVKKPHHRYIDLQNYDAMVRRLSKNKTYEDENYFIKRVEVIRQKSTLKK